MGNEQRMKGVAKSVRSLYIYFMALGLLSGRVSIHRVETPLGIVSCGLIGSPLSCEVSDQYNQNNGVSVEMTMPNYKVQLISFKLPWERPESEYITGSLGWLWRIQKLTDTIDQIELYCKLSAKRNAGVNFDSASGESLDAIAAYNEDWILHLGTEDGESLHNRATKNDGIPMRFKDDLDIQQSFTTVKRTGFKTAVPYLNKGENFHIHYLMAYGKRDENNVDTWLAVDVPKRKIENWVGVR
jgi:hypothetical protein